MNSPLNLSLLCFNAKKIGASTLKHSSKKGKGYELLLQGKRLICLHESLEL